MNTYEIYIDDFQFRMGTAKSLIPSMSGDEIFDTYMSGDTRITSNSFDPHCVGRYETREAAEAKWEFYRNWGRTYVERGQTQWILRGELAWMEELDCDENGEDCFGVIGTIHVSAAPYIREE